MSEAPGNIVLSLAVSAKGQGSPDEFLEALGAERVLSRPDVDVHIARDGPWPIGLNTPPNVVLHAHEVSQPAAVLWGRAIAASTGKFVAVLDLHSPPGAGWLTRVMREIERETPLYFGSVELGWDSLDGKTAAYLVDYGQFMAPIPSWLKEVPGNNFVCRRDLFPAAAELKTRGLFKTFMIWRLDRERIAPLFFNDMPVVYRNPFSLGLHLARRLEHGRCFALHRNDNPRQPPPLACLAFTPLLPFLRFSRVARHAWRNRNSRRALLRHWHLALLLEMAWSFGELRGYATRLAKKKSLSRNAS